MPPLQMYKYPPLEPSDIFHNFCQITLLLINFFIQRKHGVPNQVSKPKIPVPRAKSTAKHKLKKIGMINPIDLGSTHQETVKGREDLNQKQHRLLEIKAHNGVPISSEERTVMLEPSNQSKGETIARDILADKVRGFSLLSIIRFAFRWLVFVLMFCVCVQRV